MELSSMNVILLQTREGLTPKNPEHTTVPKKKA